MPQYFMPTPPTATAPNLNAPAALQNAIAQAPANANVIPVQNTATNPNSECNLGSTDVGVTSGGIEVNKSQDALHVSKKRKVGALSSINSGTPGSSVTPPPTSQATSAIFWPTMALMSSLPSATAAMAAPLGDGTLPPFFNPLGAQLSTSDVGSGSAANKVSSVNASLETSFGAGQQLGHDTILQTNGQLSSAMSAKQFICPRCNATFKTNSNMQKHVRTVHDNARPFKCDKCAASYGHKNLLVEHVRTAHEHERPFACPKCNARFGRSSNLYSHLKSHDPKREHTCETCHISFSLHGNMVKHIKTVHLKQRPFGCQTCSARFGLRSDLTRHMRNVHGINNAESNSRSGVRVNTSNVQDEEGLVPSASGSVSASELASILPGSPESDARDVSMDNEQVESEDIEGNNN